MRYISDSRAVIIPDSARMARIAQVDAKKLNSHKPGQEIKTSIQIFAGSFIWAFLVDTELAEVENFPKRLTS